MDGVSPSSSDDPRAAVERHSFGRGAWLRAAVLGADDGLVSTASLILGVLAASGSRSAVLTAGIAGLVAGSASMAAGEYVSVGSQRDAEQADLARERAELAADPAGELEELAAIYRSRGLPADLAQQVARQLTEAGALQAHARDELGFSDASMARPLQAAVVSAVSFALGAVVPVLAVLLMPSPPAQSVAVVAGTVLALGILGGTGARLGRAPLRPGVLRVLSGGIAAMAVTSLIGRVLGTAVGV